jgi:hypothetical protein
MLYGEIETDKNINGMTEIKLEKQKLLGFIKRYSLGKENDSVKFRIDSDNSNVEVRFITDDRSMVGEVYLKGVASGISCEFGVFDTSKLSKMISVLGENISMSFEKNKSSEISSIVFSDGTAEVSYMTAKTHIIPKVPALKNLPEFQFGVEINEDMARAIRMGVSSVFSSSDKIQNFTISKKKETALLSINHLANANSNKIRYEVPIVKGKEELGKEMTFTAKFLNQVLISNGDFFIDSEKKIQLMISELGIATIFIETEDFLSKYYLTEIKNK